MTATGAGLYLAYTPFSAMLFDRLIAATRFVGTAGFLIYVADAAGYAGTVGLLLVRVGLARDVAWLDFLIGGSYVVCGVTLAFIAASALYFYRSSRARRRSAPVVGRGGAHGSD